MKFIQYIKSLFLILGLLLISACNETEITTRINKDGSCERLIRLDSSSPDEFFNHYFIHVDSTWTIYVETNEDTASADTMRIKHEKPKAMAKKYFKNINALNQSMQFNPDTTACVKMRISLEKKFRWFNTYYIYHEKYMPANPFTKLPILDYLSREELEKWIFEDESAETESHKKDHKLLENKIEQFYADAIFESFYDVFLEAIKKLNHPRLSCSYFQNHKELMYQMIYNTIEEGNFGDYAKQAVQAIAAETKNRYVLLLLDEEHDFFHLFNIQETFFLNIALTDFTNRIQMPGLILDTNSEQIEGNTAIWKFDGDLFLFTEHLMWVESRVVNPWAWGITAVVFVLLVLGIVLPLRNRNRSK